MKLFKTLSKPFSWASRKYAGPGGYSPSLAGKTDLAGQLDIKLAPDTTVFDFEVRADSFRPETRRGIAVTNAPKAMRIQLDRGIGLDGWVLLPSGEPAAKAKWVS